MLDRHHSPDATAAPRDRIFPVNAKRLVRTAALLAAGLGLCGCVVYPASYYGPPARYGYYAPPPPPPPHGWYGPRPWR